MINNKINFYDADEVSKLLREFNIPISNRTIRCFEKLVKENAQSSFISGLIDIDEAREIIKNNLESFR